MFHLCRDVKDNPDPSFIAIITKAAYFWIDSDWIQRDHFDSWVIDVFTLIAVIFLVIIVQNLLIALMK